MLTVIQKAMPEAFLPQEDRGPPRHDGFINAVPPGNIDTPVSTQDSGPESKHLNSMNTNPFSIDIPTNNCGDPEDQASSPSSIMSSSNFMSPSSVIPSSNVMSPSSKEDLPPLNLITTRGELVWSAVVKAKGIKGFESVVLMDGKWTEISCGIYGKNAIKDGGPKNLRYLSHVVGA